MSNNICNKELFYCQDCPKLKMENEKLGQKLQAIQNRLKKYEDASENEGNSNQKFKNFISELRDILDADRSHSKTDSLDGFDVEMDFNFLLKTLKPPQIFEQTAEQKAFSNPLIVRTVLKHVPTPSVFSWRLINRLWCAEATTQLLTSPTHARQYRVVFSWSVERAEFEHLTMGNLSDFNEFLNDRENSFPVHYFHFEGGDLGSQDAQLFFTKYGGKMVTTLRLNLKGGHRVTKIHVLRALILDQVPRLTHLRFENTPWSDATPNTNTNSISSSSDKRLFLFSQCQRTLPHLEYLRFDTTANIPANLVFDLLTAAVNLKQTHDPALRFVYQLISANKVHTVTSVAWTYKQQDLSRLMLFADTQPKLTSLALNFDFIRRRPDQWSFATNFLNKILASDTLEVWNRLPSIDFLTGVRIPPMPKLSTVGCTESMKYKDLELFPPALNLEAPSVFPSVTTISVYDSSERLGGAVLAQLISPLAVLPAARITNPPRKPAAGWIQMIAPAFPQLQVLSFQISTMADVPDFLKTVWKVCPGLKKLSCDIRYEPKNLDKNSCADMDSAITGISVEICKKLRKIIHQTHISSCAETKDSTAITMGSVDFMRQNVSILNLKGLQSVRFFLRDFGVMSKNVPLFSPVSFVYGFDLLQKRQPFQITFTHGFVQSDLVQELSTF